MSEMTPVEALGAPVQPPPAASLSDALDGQAFLNLFVAQLKYQNPLEPSEGAEMMLQTAQFSQVEMLTQLLEAQQELMGMGQVTAALGLVGRHVTAALPDGAVSGVVTGYRVDEGGPVLEVDGHDVPLELASQVRDAPP